MNQMFSLATIFDFERPGFLVLLLLLPLLYFGVRWTLTHWGRGRLFSSLILRVLLMSLLLLALGGTILARRQRRVCAILLADLSRSISEENRAEMESFVAKCKRLLKGENKWALVGFAGDQRLTKTADQKMKEVPLAKYGSDKDDEGHLSMDETNIAAALGFGAAVAPVGYLRHIILMSDGNETRGDAKSIALRLAEQGTRVFTLPLQKPDRPEFLLERMTLPSEAKKSQPFKIRATARSNTSLKVLCKLYRNRFLIKQKSFDIQTGRSTIELDESSPTEGLVNYELIAEPEAGKDFTLDNNAVSGSVSIRGKPRILYLEGAEREGRHLVKALAKQDINVELRGANGMPGTLEELSSFDLLILSDVPATALTAAQMRLITAYVEDLGGGFIMMGGENSFGPGGYYRTPLERILPVRVKGEKKEEEPSLAMMLVIDKSGSMTGEKVELAKEASIATVELLRSKDYVGVVAFDADAYWACELARAANKMEINDLISQIQAGGGTNIYPALSIAYEALAAISAKLKHVILLTDGHSQPGDFEGIINSMSLDKITISTVAIGQAADENLLEQMAEWGGGRFYFTEDALDVPKIFTRETMLASKSSIIEEPFVPAPAANAEILEGLDMENAPFLLGYVRTTPKDTAEVILTTHRGDPLLARWRYGLGQAVAFTSDAKSRWAADWLDWKGYSKFWAQVIRKTMRTSKVSGMSVELSDQKRRIKLAIDAADEKGNFLDGLATTALAILPDQTRKELKIPQVAPGRYEAEMQADAIGAYVFRITQLSAPSRNESEGRADMSASNKEGELINETTRILTIPYPEEYLHQEVNENLLKELADATNGKYKPTPEQIFQAGEQTALARKKIWPNLLVVAVFIFVLDVAMRRVDIER